MQDRQITFRSLCARLLLTFSLFFVMSHDSLVAQDKAAADSVFALGQDHYKKGMDLLKKGEKSQALKQFSDAADLFGDYETYLYSKLDSIKPIMQALLDKEPQSPVFSYLMGKWYQSAQRDTVGQRKAWSFYERAVQIEPRFTWAYMGLASVSSRKGDNEEAVKNYSRAIDADPEFASAYSYLASTYEQMGKEDEALRVRKQLLQRDSTSSSATMVMLELARKAKALGEKEDLYWKAIRLSTSSELREGAYRELLWALGAEKPDSAESLARWILSKNITSDKYTRQTAQLAIFNSLTRTHRDKVPAYAEGLLGEKDPRVLGEIGVFCLDSLHNIQVALQCLGGAYKVCTKDFVEGTLIHGFSIPAERLVQVAKEYGSGFLARKLGQAYYELKEYDNAEKFFRESIDYAVKNSYPTALYQLGYALREKGNKGEAIKWLTQGLAMKHDDQALAALEKLLTEMGSKQSATEAVNAERRKSAKPAPDFKLATLKSDTVQLSKLKGKVVMLDFWATWCGPCVSELPNLAKLYKKYADNPKILFFSIDTNEPASSIKPFMEKYNYSFNVLLGNLTSVSHMYGVDAIPTKFLVDQSGRIQFKHIGGGPDPKVIDELSKEIDELLSANVD